MTDPINVSPMPPVPNAVGPLRKLANATDPATGQLNIENGVIFNTAWVQWFVQLKTKIDTINEALVALSQITGSGIVVTDSTGMATTRTLQGTSGNISITNADGIAGDPLINLADTGVTPGTYGDGTHIPQIDIDEKGRITAATEVGVSLGSSGITPGTYGDSTHVAQVTFDSSGIATAASNVAISGGGSGAMTLIGSSTVTGSAASTLTISGLDLATDGSYYVRFALGNATGSSSDIALYYNSDTTATNYYRQSANFNNTTLSGARSNNATIVTMDANETVTTTFTVINDLDGKPRAVCLSNRGAPSSIFGQMFFHAWTSATNVTGITLSASVANSLAVGSYIKVFSIN